MTAHELAKQLLEGPDLIVTVSGYEGGVDEITSIDSPEPIKLNVNTEWYYGKHAYEKFPEEGEDLTMLPKAIHIA